MREVEKVSGGRVYIRPLDQRFEIGDRVTVDAELSAYLCEERGDFDVVETEAERAPDETDVGDTDATALADEDVDEAADDDADFESFEDGIETVRDAVAFDPSEHTNDEIAELVEDVDSAEELDAIRELETAGKNRTGALDAIDDRLDELEG